MIKCPARRRRQFAIGAPPSIFFRFFRDKFFAVAYDGCIGIAWQQKCVSPPAGFVIPLYLTSAAATINQATEILSGASYSTSALVLLFKSEICHVLSPSDGDSHIWEEFKSNMRTQIDYRIPIHDVHVCAVMLDPAQRHLSAVQEFLDNKGVTKYKLTAVNFLEQMMIDKFASNNKLQEGTIGVECEESTDRFFFFLEESKDRFVVKAQ